MKKLFEPESIAIVGASAQPGKVGNMLVDNIAGHEYTGRVHYINHNRGEINGQQALGALSELPEDVDLAIIAIPGEHVLDVIRDGHERCKYYIVISAGFGETGFDGHNREMELLSFAREHDLTILGPNCLGILAPHSGLNASFAPVLPAPGRLAFISQSGALAVALVDRAHGLGLGMSHVVSIGNKMQLTSSELIRYFADDDKTDVIALYLEGIRDGAAFLTAAAYARDRNKQVIILKAGRTSAAQKAIALHTGSLAGSDDVISQAFVQSGVIRAESIDALFMLAQTSLHQKYLPAHETVRVGVVTNAGGPGVLTSDAIASSTYLTLGALSHEDAQILTARLPDAASVHNPIDLLGDAGLDRYKVALDICLASTEIDVVMVLLTPQDQTPAQAIAEMIIEKQRTSEKLIVTSFIGGDSVVDAIAQMRVGDVLHAASPEHLVRTLDDVYKARTQTYASAVAPQQDKKRTKQSTIILERAAAGALYTEDVFDLAFLYAIPMSTFWDVTEGLGAEAQVTYPCVAKVDDPHILHKSDRGGVILPIGSGAALEEARLTLRERFPEMTARVIAQPLLPIKVELIIGMKRDPIFGPVIVVGMGGIYTEVLKRRELFVGYADHDEITRRLQEGILGFFFSETRGQESYDVDAVAQVVTALMCMAEENATIQAIDINPLLIYNDGQRSVAVDMKVVVE